MTTKVILVHPDDVNLADVKAAAARFDSTVVGSRFVPRGRMYVGDGSVLDWQDGPDSE